MCVKKIKKLKCDGSFFFGEIMYKPNKEQISWSHTLWAWFVNNHYSKSNLAQVRFSK